MGLKCIERPGDGVGLCRTENKASAALLGRPMANVKAIATALRGISGILAVVTVSAALLAACGKSKTVEEYIHSAETHRDAGELPAAVIDLKNALQKDPKNLTARLMLGQSYVDMSDGPSGEAELLNAKQAGATAIQIAKPMAEAELLLGKPNNTLKETDQLPPDAPPALKASLLSLRGRAYLALGQFDNARDAFAAGLQADPHSTDVITGKARYLLARGDIGGAREQVALAERETPKSPSIAMLKGTIDLSARQFPEAEQAFESVITAHPWNLIDRLYLAQAQIAQDKLKAADANLSIVLKAAPNDPRTNYFRALSAYRAKDFGTAKTYSEHAIAAAKDFAPALLLAGASNYGLKQYEQANTYLGQYVFQVPQNVEGRKLLAAVQLQLGHPKDAVRTLAPAVQDNNSDAQLLAMIGTAAARSGDLAEANRYLALASAKQPDNSAVRTQLGVTDIALGQTDTGIQELEKADQEDPDALRPAIALVTAYMHEKQFDKALAVAERLQKSHPQEAIGFDLAGMVNLAKGDKDNARTALLKARDLHPGDPLALRVLAAMEVEVGNLAGATQY